MAIGPVPNLPPIRVTQPASTAPETERARAIEFRGQQQGQNQDATYTPGHDKEESASEHSDSVESNSAASEEGDAAIPGATPSKELAGEPDAVRTISFFA